LRRAFPTWSSTSTTSRASGTPRVNGASSLKLAPKAGSRITLAEWPSSSPNPRRANSTPPQQRHHSRIPSGENPDQYSVTAFGTSDWPIEFFFLSYLARLLENVGPSAPRTLLGDLWQRGRRPHAGATPAWTYAALRIPLRVLAFALIAVPLGAHPAAADAAAHASLRPCHCRYDLLFIMGAGMAARSSVCTAVGCGPQHLLVPPPPALLPRMARYWSGPRRFLSSRDSCPGVACSANGRSRVKYARTPPERRMVSRFTNSFCSPRQLSLPDH